MMAADDFNRANAETLGANWTAVNGNFRIVNNRARVDGFDSLVAYIAVAPASTDYSVEATIFFEPAATTAAGVAARVSSTQMTGYMLSASATTIYLERYVNGVYTSLATVSMTGPSGSRLRLTVSGTNPVLLTCEMDTGSGFEPIADIGTDGVYSDSDASRITDAGYAGVYGYSLLSGNMDVDDWSFSDLVIGVPVTISGISDTTLAHGQTGIVITGTNFSASGNTVLISPTDDVEDVDAVAQTITAESATEITFTADLDSFDFGATLYLFVINGDSESNADGEAVTRVIGSATLSATFIGQDDQARPNLTDIKISIWRGGTISGAPDQQITAETTDESGLFETEIEVGALEDGDKPFVVVEVGSPPTIWTCGLKDVTYE